MRQPVARLSKQVFRKSLSFFWGGIGFYAASRCRHAALSSRTPDLGRFWGNAPVKDLSPTIGFLDKGSQVFNVKAYGAKGEDVVAANFTAIDAALAGLHEARIGSIGPAAASARVTTATSS